MKKAKILLSIIVLLLFLTVALFTKYIKISEKYNSQQDSINSNFKSALNLATSDFAVDFNTQSEEKQQYYYNEAMINLASASYLFQSTSYHAQNNGLDITLNNLYKLMEQKEYKDAIMKESKSIYNNLLKLSQNPGDKKSTDNIINLTKKIEQEKGLF